MKMVLNFLKPKLFVCISVIKKTSSRPNINKIYNLQIPVVSQTKFLGVIFDNKLNFKAHIDYIHQRCEKAMNLLKVVAKMDWLEDRSVLMRFYHSFVHSRLEYGCAVLVLLVSLILRNWSPSKTRA